MGKNNLEYELDENNYFLPKDYKLFNKEFNHSFDKDKFYNEDKSFWNSERIRLSGSFQLPIYNYISKKVEKHSTVLDIGCGVATKLMNVIQKKSSKVFGIDQPSAIDFAKKIHCYENLHSCNFDDPSTWGLEIPSIDLIICSDVIEHVVYPDNLLNLIKNFSSDKTKIFISTPNRDYARGKKNRFSPKKEHIREWNDLEMKTYLLSRNFEVLKITHHLPYDIRKHGLKASLYDFYSCTFVNKGKFNYNMLLECKLKL